TVSQSSLMSASHDEPLADSAAGSLALSEAIPVLPAGIGRNMYARIPRRAPCDPNLHEFVVFRPRAVDHGANREVDSHPWFRRTELAPHPRRGSDPAGRAEAREVQ